VVAIDVGHGQLSPALANHPGVRAIDGLDIRQARMETLGGPFELVVADLSFISLCAVAAALAAATRPGGALICLVKPQFEVGRDRIKRGVVTDPILQEEVVAAVGDCFTLAGLDTVGVMESPIIGEHGNQEYLLFAKRGAI
jgi:23S rRNA (cytidine1920-2'-O)/16S rRNA (cytidine1409-2'-O)-methyltransferase